MSKVLVISGHPNLSKSKYNVKILEAIKDMENVTIHSIATEKELDIAKEQKLLLEHDVIVFQFPFSWYSVPAVLKKWFDEVFLYGFAYGEGGDKLKGKKVLFSITVGSPKSAYNKDGYNLMPVKDLLNPFVSTFSLTQSIFLEPFVIYACNPNPEYAISDEDFAKSVNDYKNLISSFLK